MNWGYESITTHIPVSVGVYSQYCEFDNFDPSNYNYWVEIGDGNNCNTKSYFNTPIYTTSIPEIINSKINVYPNPFADEIFVELFSTYDKDYSIFDLQGGLVLFGSFSNGLNKIETESLNIGMYLLFLNDNYENGAIKIFKN
jgi:hypothetical protein